MRRSRKQVASFPDSDANVTFCLNLSSNSGYNHKQKCSITLAYDLKSQSERQDITLLICLGLR
ncbi:hypothetical protein C3369_01540 [Escherichia sp. ESNIH1]|nr:hypothetical protein C3369_01540 [Escherichia sp. ESNIH1]